METGGVAIYRPFGEFCRAKLYCHLYGAQGQRQAYLKPHATMNFVGLDLSTSDRERAEVDMPLRHFRKQHEQLSQFERVRIIGMMEAGWSAKRVARQLGCSDCVVRRCSDQWIREMSFTRRPDSGRTRQTGPGSPFTRGYLCPYRTVRRRLAEGHLGSRLPLRVLPLTPPPSTPPFGMVPRTRKLDCSGMEPGHLQRRIQVQSQLDEAHFWLNGYVNKQNYRIWSEANPQVHVKTPLHPEKLTVLCAVWAGGILLQKR
ncbi:transposable element Tcb2 transposase [Trichonephila clavipes]|nr:transposable element Tcb2 transposase [Trichonephila clavipes]